MGTGRNSQVAVTGSSMLQAAHQRLSRRHVATVPLVFAAAALGGCMDTSSGDNNVSSVSARTYSLGAKISGLNSSGLVLAVNARRQSIGAHPSPAIDRLDYSGLTV